jgi:excisionase family DNA binding protein
MTVREVAAYLRVHLPTIYRLLRQNQIPAFRIGGDWRFNIEAIDHWRRQQEKAEFTKAMRRSGPAEMTSYERKRFDQQAGNCVDCGASLSRHSDGQPGNPSHGDGLPHHHVHPSVERRFNRDEATR